MAASGKGFLERNVENGAENARSFACARSPFHTSAVHTNSFPAFLNSLIPQSRCGLSFVA